jgi:hypothetical protein
MITIIQSRIIQDTRVQGRAGMVLGEHVFSDGDIWPAAFECLADEDAQVRLEEMIEAREAKKNFVPEEGEE